MGFECPGESHSNNQLRAEESRMDGAEVRGKNGRTARLAA
jgi:hypothetical protein